MLWQGDTEHTSVFSNAMEGKQMVTMEEALSGLNNDSLKELLKEHALPLAGPKANRIRSLCRFYRSAECWRELLGDEQGKAFRGPCWEALVEDLATVGELQNVLSRSLPPRTLKVVALRGFTFPDKELHGEDRAASVRPLMNALTWTKAAPSRLTPNIYKVFREMLRAQGYDAPGKMPDNGINGKLKIRRLFQDDSA